MEDELVFIHCYRRLLDTYQQPPEVSAKQFAEIMRRLGVILEPQTAPSSVRRIET